MKSYKLKTSYKRLLSDTTTPVSIYLRIRDIFPNSILLESSDYHSRENSMSYVCCDPIAGIRLDEQELYITYPDGDSIIKNAENLDLRDEISKFRKSFIDSFDE
jgi:anthranilate synthase component 1